MHVHYYIGAILLLERKACLRLGSTLVVEPFCPIYAIA